MGTERYSPLSLVASSPEWHWLDAALTQLLVSEKIRMIKYIHNSTQLPRQPLLSRVNASRVPCQFPTGSLPYYDQLHLHSSHSPRCQSQGFVRFPLWMMNDLWKSSYHYACLMLVPEQQGWLDTMSLESWQRSSTLLPLSFRPTMEGLNPIHCSVDFGSDLGVLVSWCLRSSSCKIWHRDSKV